jgi:hypothetical protein
LSTLNQQTNTNAIPNHDIFYSKFKLNGSSALNVNGTTPKVFRLEDLTMDNIILNRVDFLISAGTDIDLTNFGGLTLANGVQFNIDGSQLFKTNGDIMLFASDVSMHSAKVEGTLTTIINGHWDLVKAFQNGLVCKVEDLTVIIQDDLSSLNFFEVSASGVKL